MPEGDTVARAAGRMQTALAGRVVTGSDFRVPRWATADLAGRTVLEVVPRGKHLLTRFSGGLTLHTHFRLEGSWHLYRPGEPWTGGPHWQIRVVLTTAERVAVGYRLPVIDLLPTSEEANVVGHLGPDVLGPDWDLERVLVALTAEPDRPVGAALLDQRILAGLGNIYRTEACFLHGVTPWTPVGSVEDPGRLVERARALIRANIDRPERSTTGSSRRGETHWVYGRGARPCRRCGTPIRRAEQSVAPPPPDPNHPNHPAGPVKRAGPAGGPTRVTYWCPSCQRGPGPPDAGPASGAPGPGGTSRRATGAAVGRRPFRAAAIRPGTGRSGGPGRG